MSKVNFKVNMSYMICPKCGAHLYFDGKCFVCVECGYWSY